MQSPETLQAASVDQSYIFNKLPLSDVKLKELFNELSRYQERQAWKARKSSKQQTITSSKKPKGQCKSYETTEPSDDDVEFTE